MTIRKAKSEESKAIAPLMLLAMEDIVYQFIGEDSLKNATLFLEDLISEKANQYSYENCWVVESDNEIVAVANVYDGAKLYELRKPVLAYIKNKFQRDFTPENETAEGEFYIDSVGVRSDQQGKGVGSKIFRFLINEYCEKNNLTLGLLVDKDNPNAKKLYLKLGFDVIDEMILTGKEMEHLQFKKSSN